MAIDNRKSKEDIDRSLDKLDEEAPEEPPKEIPEKEEEPEEDKPIEEVPEDENLETEEEEPVKPAEVETPQEIDYKQKFSESTREAQVLSAKNRKLIDTIEVAANLPDPLEEECKREYPDWEDLTDFEKQVAKDNLLNKKKFELVHEAVLEAKKVDEWVEKVDKYLEEDGLLEKHPELEGREAEFRSFCLKPTRRGVEFEDLISAFLFNIKPEKQHRGSLLETGSGGPKELKPKELTASEIKRIRETDQKKYRQLIKEGKIKIEI